MVKLRDINDLKKYWSDGRKENAGILPLYDI